MGGYVMGHWDWGWCLNTKIVEHLFQEQGRAKAIAERLVIIQPGVGAHHFELPGRSQVSWERCTPTPPAVLAE